MCFVPFVLFLHLICLSGSYSQSGLVLLSGCPCPSHTLLYECTVVEDGTGGATVWQGTALDCGSKNNEIILLHNRFGTVGTSEECNNGAIVGWSLKVEGNRYTSQLTVSVSPDMIGGTVVCAVDNGGTSTVISSLSILPNTYFIQVHIRHFDFGFKQLMFNWSTSGNQSSMPDCPALHYTILSPNCGSCPTTTTNTSVTCTDVPTDGNACTFAVQTASCGGMVKGRPSDLVSITTLVDQGNSDGTSLGALIGVTLLAAILFTCVGCLTIAVIVLLKGRLKVPKRAQPSKSSGPQPARPSQGQTDPQLNTNENVSYGLPSSMSTKVDTNENAAYGLPSSMKITKVDTKENISYGLPSSMKSTKRAQENYENA